MTYFTPITVPFVGYTSAMDGWNNLFNTKLPFEQQRWASNGPERQFIYVGFDGLYRADSLYIPEMGSDQTTHKAIIEARGLHLEDKAFKPAPSWIFALWDANIRRGGPDGMGLSIDNKGDAYRPIKDGWLARRNVIGSVKVSLGSDTLLAGLVFEIFGHGWYSAEALRVTGECVEKFSSAQLAMLRTFIVRKLDPETCVMWDA